MTEQVKNIIRFILFILVQVFVLNKIPPLHEYIVPYIYFLFLLWLPFKMATPILMITGFVFGLCLDYFLATPGLHAAACVLICFIRPFIISILMPKETQEFNYIAPSIVSMGIGQYIIYITTLTLLHNVYIVFLEWLQFGDPMYFIGKALATSAVSLLLIMITELLFYRKEKFRTNTV